MQLFPQPLRTLKLNFYSLYSQY